MGLLRYLSIERLKLIGAFIAGLLIGWLIIGWWLWPVNWINADPWDLRPEFKVEYVKMAADSYTVEGNQDLLRKRFAGWPKDDLAKVIAEVEKSEPGRMRVAPLKDILGVSPQATPQPVQGKAGGKGLLGCLWPLLLLLMLLAVALLVGSWLWRRRQAVAGPARAETESRVLEPVEATEVQIPTGLVCTHRAVYTFGDLRFDETFPVEAEDGTYFGECGIGVLETAGTGDPPKVIAFDVWLFDKDTARTVNKALASRYAWSDETYRDMLASKTSTGEVVPAEPGPVMEIETPLLRMEVVVDDLGYGDGEGIADTYFTKLAVTLKVFRKEAPSSEESAELPAL